VIIFAIAACLGLREQFALKFKNNWVRFRICSVTINKSSAQTEIAQLDLGAKDFGIIFCGLGLNQLPWGN